MSVFTRAAAMLFHPFRTWRVIADEPVDDAELYRRYVAPLAAIPAVAGAVGALIFGFNIANVGLRMSFVGLALSAAASYVATLVAVWILGQFAGLIAPLFGGARDRHAGLRLAAYSATAAWVGGLANLYPSLGIPVGILAGIYSLYALYLGLPPLLRVPEDRRLTTFAVLLLGIAALAAGRGEVVAKAAEIGGPLSASYPPPR